MKRFFLVCGFVFLVTATVSAQNGKKSKTPSINLLQGTWLVSDKALLPVAQDNRKEFLKDTLIFSSTNEKQFSNGQAKQSSKAYEYDEAEKQLIILEVATLEGMQYEVKSLTETELVIVVVNAQQNAFIDLVYKRINP